MPWGGGPLLQLGVVGRHVVKAAGALLLNGWIWAGDFSND